MNQLKITEDSILYSEDTQEVLSKVPPRLVSISLYCISIIFLILILGSYIFRYPDSVQSEVLILPSKPTQPLIARSTGYLSSIFYANGDLVHRGDILAELQSSALAKDVLYIESYVLTARKVLLQGDSPKSIEKLALQLGSLEASYTTVRQDLEKLLHFNELNYYPQRIALQKEINNLGIKQLKINDEQRVHALEQIRIASQEHVRDSLLYAQGMLAAEDLEKSRARLISHLSNEALVRQSIHGKTQQIAEGAISVFELEQKYQTEEETLRFNLLSSIDLFLARIQEWKDLYLIQAAISGSLTYWGNRYVGQNIQQGDQLFTITPLEASPSVGVLHIPPTGSGKVKSGQRVLIRLTNYPDHEFGTLEASIHTLSTSTDKEGVYLAEVTFPNGLVTSYKKNLPEDVELRGSAEIITHDRSLLERILSPIYKIFDQSISGRTG